MYMSCIPHQLFREKVRAHRWRGAHAEPPMRSSVEAQAPTWCERGSHGSLPSARRRDWRRSDEVSCQEAQKLSLARRPGRKSPSAVPTLPAAAEHAHCCSQRDSVPSHLVVARLSTLGRPRNDEPPTAESRRSDAVAPIASHSSAAALPWHSWHCCNASGALLRPEPGQLFLEASVLAVSAAACRRPAVTIAQPRLGRAC